ncbi:hypothetical protein GZ77_13110 [Endozoicomonas montiporae]|uniref:Lipoprotein n=2 Tax=Endozoicomonas montiporae TaxID=1027273 RepID=A0A081N4H8_9GAMM|nr:YajG family lipoprotein [Endozoicomonas montiporae]AMO57793.1 hypothetical protein EZMO1_3851 [Endozoicomonas montiporae CL-33]KEQ13351.1 hypothetical protein GZ77_13110 [Endozoicomonas montiporae]
MMTTKLRWKSLLPKAGLVAMLALGGCAMSPQSIQVNPSVTVAESVRNSLSSSVSVTVFDERLTPVIGFRGGVYDSNEITARDNLPLALRSAVERGLREMGVSVVTSGEAPQFQVYLDSLEYRVPEGSYVTSVEVQTRIRVAVLHKGKRFEGSYSADISERVPKAPSDKKNEQLVNQVLSDVLERLFADQKLQSFMKTL